MAALTQTASSAVPSARAKYLPAPVTAGAAIAAGQPFYIDSSNLAQLTDANASATTAQIHGIAVNSAATGQPVVGIYDDPDFQHGLTGVVAGDPLFTHGTAGGIGLFAENASGYYVSLIGIATSATKAVVSFVKSGVAK